MTRLAITFGPYVVERSLKEFVVIDTSGNDERRVATVPLADFGDDYARASCAACDLASELNNTRLRIEEESKDG